MRQISAINNKPERTKRTVKFRPLSESGIAKFKDWLKELSWEKLYLAKNIHQKAEILQETLITALNKFLPEKYVTFCSDDQTLITAELKELKERENMNPKCTGQIQICSKYLGCTIRSGLCSNKKSNR